MVAEIAFAPPRHLMACLTRCVDVGVLAGPHLLSAVVAPSATLEPSRGSLGVASRRAGPAFGASGRFGPISSQGSWLREGNVICFLWAAFAAVLRLAAPRLEDGACCGLGLSTVSSCHQLPSVAPLGPTCLDHAATQNCFFRRRPQAEELVRAIHLERGSPPPSAQRRCRACLLGSASMAPTATSRAST